MGLDNEEKVGSDGDPGDDDDIDDGDMVMMMILMMIILMIIMKLMMRLLLSAGNLLKGLGNLCLQFCHLGCVEENSIK